MLSRSPPLSKHVLLQESMRHKGFLDFHRLSMNGQVYPKVLIIDQIIESQSLIDPAPSLHRHTFERFQRFQANSSIHSVHFAADNSR